MLLLDKAKPPQITINIFFLQSAWDQQVAFPIQTGL